MPCPKPKKFSGSGEVTVGFRPSSAKAKADAIAAVPGAAKGSAIHEAIESSFCPQDCPYPRAYGVTFTVTSVSVSWQWFFNIFLFGWFSAAFGDGWFYSGTAYYTWSAWVSCHKERLTFALADDEIIEPSEPLG